MAPEQARIRPDRLKRLLKKLVDIYSPSGKEADAVEFLGGWLRRRGLPVTLQEVDDERENLLVLPPGGEAQLALVGHLDTVVAYDLEDFGATEEGERVVGLGAADMKGGCAAMIEAVTALWEAGDPPPVALALVVGEEEDGDGAATLAEEHRFPWAVIGEPTGLAPCLEHYGYLEARLEAAGLRRHAALAAGGQNPIEDLLRLLLRVTGYFQKERPEAIYNVRDILSSPQGFVVPDFAEAWLDSHFPPDAPLGEITYELEELVEAARAEIGDRPLTLELTTIQSGYSLPDRGSLPEALQAVFRRRGLPWEPRAFRSHSDANQLWAAGIRPLLLGPGSLEQAHAPEEWVSWPQVLEAAHLYLDLAKSLTPDR